MARFEVEAEVVVRMAVTLAVEAADARAAEMEVTEAGELPGLPEAILARLVRSADPDGEVELIEVQVASAGGPIGEEEEVA
jgi:hypothetical protein